MNDSNPRRACARHPQAPAIAVCTECGGDVCAVCHGSDLRGYCICPDCRLALAPPTTPWEDPRVDYSPRAFGQTLREVITGPRSFFQNVRFSDSWAPAAAFGLICMAVGLLFSTGWQLLLLDGFSEAMADYAEQAEIGADSFQTLLFVTVPVRALLGFLVHVGVLHLAIRLAGSRSTFSLTTRIVGYACGAYILLLVPPIAEFTLGHFLAIIWLFNLEATALRAYFGMSFWRSIFVVLGTLMLVWPFVA